MSTLTLATPRDFRFDAAVGSYGYCQLAPNVWSPGEGVLRTTLRAGGQVVQAVITATPNALRLKTDRTVDRAEQQAIKSAARRMLRLDENLGAFHRMYPQARKTGFGRLLRSATLFEDVVKTMTSCNVAWPSTVRMNARLCEHFGDGAFPTPQALARVEPEQLKEIARVGYRAERIVRLARDVADGRLDLDAFEAPGRDSEELFDALRRIHGVGPYAAANILQHLGRYDRLPIDSECYAHFCRKFELDKPDNPASLDHSIREHYDRYAPFQFLVYWHELWSDYVKGNDQ